MKHEHSIMLINRKATVAQCKMERIMLDTSLHNRKRNIWIRQQTGVNDIINTIQTGKHSCVGPRATLQADNIDGHQE